MRFTDTFIKNLKPSGVRYDVRESDGFCVRVSPTGHKTWVYIYTINGCKKRITLGVYPDVSLSKARIYHAEKRNMVKNGIDPAVQTKRKDFTLARLVNEYIENYAKKEKKTWKIDKNTLDNNFVNQLGSMNVADINRWDIAQVIRQIKDRGANAQAVNALCIIRRVFRFAVSEGIVEINPCLLIEKPATIKAKSRYLSESEIVEFWHRLTIDRYLNPNMKNLLKLILVTAQRPGEVAGIRRDEIDGDWWTIPEHRHKAERGHRVFLSPLTKSILPDADGWLLAMNRTDKPCDVRSPSYALARLIKRCGFETPFTPHDLRRTAATHMGNLGIPPFVVGQVLGHADQTVTTKHYNLSAYDAEKKDALSRWGKYLDGLLSSGSRESAKVIKLFG